MKAGTLLRGLGYIKGKDGPVAREDHEYPEWLWGLLDKNEKASGVGDAEAEAEAGDEYGESGFDLFTWMKAELDAREESASEGSLETLET